MNKNLLTINIVCCIIIVFLLLKFIFLIRDFDSKYLEISAVSLSFIATIFYIIYINKNISIMHKLDNRKMIIKILGKKNLTELSIQKYCISKGIPKLSETIYLFLNNTLEETADILQVDASTISRRIKKFIDISIKG